MIEITFPQKYIAPSCRKRLCISVSFCNIFFAFSGWLGHVLESTEVQNGSESPNQKTCIIFPYFFQITFLWHQSSCISTLLLSCLFFLRFWTEVSPGWLTLAILHLRSECSTSMLIFSQLFQLSPVLSWGCHISNHAVSFLSQRFSTTNVSWWLGYVHAGCVSHPPSAPTVLSVIAKRQGPSSLCPCWCGHSPCQCCSHPHPPSQSTLLLVFLGRHMLSRSESSAFTSASHLHLSVLRFLQASVNVVLATLS